jgi:spore coat polysaccharide biosynthesis protein SpsF
MTKFIAIIHGRMSSSRLPGKVLMPLAGETVFFHHVERMKQCPKVQTIFLGTSKNPNNQPLIAEANRINIPTYAGAEEDVIERYISIAEREGADFIVRCGCDKPLFSYEIVNVLLDNHRNEDLLFCTTLLGKGIGSEIISLNSLKTIHKYYRGPAISKYMHEYPHLFTMRGIEVNDEFSRPDFRLTLDTPEDYKLFSILYEEFYIPGQPVDLKNVFRYLDDNPEIANINRFSVEKQVNRYVKELETKPMMTVYREKNGKVYVLNRMGQNISKQDFFRSLENLEWD